MPSSALDELLRQLADPDEVLGEHDRYGLDLAAQLSGSERATFIGKLVDAASREERRAVLTLGLLRADEGRRVLFTLAGKKDPLGRLARHALVMLGDGVAFVHEIAADALDSGAKFHRGDAVRDLGKIRSPAARAALLEALGDREDRVRVAAWDGLVESLDLAPLLNGPEGKPTLSTELELLQVFLNSDLPAFAAIGAEELRRLVGWLESGITPALLGIAWRKPEAPELFDRLRRVLFVPEQPFPLDELAQLKGVSRRWAEAMIAFRLEAHDPRVPDAMVRLEATWVLPVLTAVEKDAKTPPELRDQLSSSIRTLWPLTKPAWILAFRSTTTVPLATYAAVLAKVLGAPARIDEAEVRGNPRDGYFGDVTVSAQRASDRTLVSFSFTQQAMIVNDSTPDIRLEGATLRAPHATFAEKLGLWHALREQLAALGCTDETLTHHPAPIVDEADPETAKRLRADITAALIAKAPSCDSVRLVSPRADDLDAVLAAYAKASSIENVTLDDCRLDALPAGLARFTSLKYLSVAQNTLGADALRGVSLPTLTTLSLLRCPIRQLKSEHLAGFPQLERLYLIDTPLEELDLGACPRLRRVLIANTPLARAREKLAALREQWKDVAWE